MESTNGKGTSWSSAQAYGMAVICLLAGLAAGYLIRGPVQPAVSAQAAPAAAPTGEQQVTPEQLKHMAEKKAEPLLAQLKTDPNNPELLAQVGNIYYDTQNYPDAVSYYQKSLAGSENADVRTDMGTAYFYAGNPDAAIAEFEKVLKANPHHDNALFNLAMVKWRGKMDVAGAVQAWQNLLKQNPNHPRKAEVEQLMAEATKHANIKMPAK